MNKFIARFCITLIGLANPVFAGYSPQGGSANPVPPTGGSSVVEEKPQDRHFGIKYKSGVCGVYNPASKTIEWRTKSEGSVAGIYNPAKQTVEWKMKFQGGVAGVYNPETQTVEWNMKYRGGVAGYYNPQTKSVVWQIKNDGGAAVVSPDPDNPTLQCSSVYYTKLFAD